MIRYTKHRTGVYLTKSIPCTRYNVTITDNNGCEYYHTFEYNRYHEDRLIKRSERKAINEFLAWYPELKVAKVKTTVISCNKSAKSDIVKIPKGAGVAKFGSDRYWLYMPVDIRTYKVRTVNVEYNTLQLNDKNVTLSGKYNKRRDSIKIEKALHSSEKLLSFELVSRTTKRIEHEVKFTWPQEDRI